MQIVYSTSTPNSGNRGQSSKTLDSSETFNMYKRVFG